MLLHCAGQPGPCLHGPSSCRKLVPKARRRLTASEMRRRAGRMRGGERGDCGSGGAATVDSWLLVSNKWLRSALKWDIHEAANQNKGREDGNSPEL